MKEVDAMTDEKILMKELDEMELGDMLCDDILFVLINLRILVTRIFAGSRPAILRQNLTTAATPCCLRFPSTLSRELRNMVRIIGRKGFRFTVTSTAPSVITFKYKRGTMTSATIEPFV